MSCLTIKSERKGGMTATSNRVGGLSLRVSLSCPIGLGKWEYLLVHEGYVLTSDNKKILVKKSIPPTSP